MYIGLLDEDFSGFCAQGFDLGLFDDLTPPKLFDLTVQVAGDVVGLVPENKSSLSNFVAKIYIHC